MKKSISKYIGSFFSIVLFMVFGALCGILMVMQLDLGFADDQSLGSTLLILLVGVMLILAAVFLQILIHEAGHLIFGLASGYRFSSFRIASLMLIREEGKLKLRRLSLAGTGGQCLMLPPDMKNGKIPFVAYNLGGPIMNALSALFFFGLYFLVQDLSFLSFFCLAMGIVGVLYALMNGVPLRVGSVDNDGRNALSLGGNPEALRAFWIQLKVNEMSSRGVRLKDMPDEWFVLADEGVTSNSMTASVAVQRACRFMDMHRFPEASSLIDELLDEDNAVLGVYRNLVTCDRLYCALIARDDIDSVEKWRSKKQLAFMKQMEKYPSVIRTEYAYAVLGENDTAKAEQAKARFVKCARTYPYKSDIETEHELMVIAEEKAQQICRTADDVRSC